MKRIVLVGAGPKSLAVAARILAHHNAAAGGATALELVFVDPHEPGPGLVWKVDQPREFLNNTPASGTTAFGDATVPGTVPHEIGPSMAEWCATPAHHAHLPPEVRAEAATVKAWDAPSRALQGWYYSWAHRRLGEAAPAGVVIHHRRARAVGLTPTDAVRLDDGSSVQADIVVLALGFVDEQATDDDLELARAGSGYHAPAALDESRLRLVDWDSPVLVRGLGATFFDLIGLIDSRGWHASTIYAGSPSGLPKRAQPAAPIAEVPAAHLTDHWLGRQLEDHAGRRTLDVSTVLELVRAEVDRVFSLRPPPRSLADPLTPWLSMVRPSATAYASATAWRDVVMRFAEQEHFTLHHPDDSPWLAARASLMSIRRRLLVLERASAFRDPELLTRQFFVPTARVSSGPPAARMALLVDKLRNGSIQLLGPGTEFRRASSGFVGVASGVSGTGVEGKTLIEAWQRYARASRAADPLISSLLDAGDARVVDHALGDALDADSDARLVRSDGSVSGSRYVLGWLAAASQRGVFQGAVPGSGDPFLVEADRAAASIVQRLAATAG